MKTYFGILLCFCLLLCSCGKKVPAEGSTESSAETVTEASSTAPEGELLRNTLLEDVTALSERREVEGDQRTYWINSKGVEAIRSHETTCLTEETVLALAEQISTRYLDDGWRFEPLCLAGINGNEETLLPVLTDHSAAYLPESVYGTLLAYTLDLLTPGAYRFSAVEVLGAETVVAMDSIWPERAWYLALGSYESREQALEGVRAGDRALLLEGYADWEGKWAFNSENCGGSVLLVGGEKTLQLSLQDMYFRATGEDVTDTLPNWRK